MDQELCGKCAKPKGDEDGCCTCGRPTKYDPKYCDEIVAFFAANEPYRETVKRAFTRPDGSTSEEFEETANDLPMYADFAHRIGVHVDTLNEWKHAYPEFSAAYKRAKQLQESHLVQNALRGNFNPTFSIFFAKNNLGYKDATEQNVSLKNDAAQDLADKVMGKAATLSPDETLRADEEPAEGAA